MTIKEIQQKVIPILTSNNVVFAGVFGSYARGDDKNTSDIDFLVRFEKPVSLMTHGGLQIELSEALQKDVDVVTEASLHPKIKDNVLSDLRVIYER